MTAKIYSKRLFIVTVNQLQSCFPIQTIGRHNFEMFCLSHKIVSMLAQSKYYKTSKAVITFFQGDYVQNPDLKRVGWFQQPLILFAFTSTSVSEDK